MDVAGAHDKPRHHLRICSRRQTAPIRHRSLTTAERWSGCSGRRLEAGLPTLMPVEGVTVAHIYARTGIVTHALPGLRPWSLFHQAGRKSDRRFNASWPAGWLVVAETPDRPVLTSLASRCAGLELCYAGGAAGVLSAQRSCRCGQPSLEPPDGSLDCGGRSRQAGASARGSHSCQ